MTPRALHRALATGAAALGLAGMLAAVPAAAYPPRACARITLDGTAYVVRIHGRDVSCSFAVKTIKAFYLHGRAPKTFRCRRFDGPTPVHCQSRRDVQRYVFVSEAPSS